MSVLDRFKTKPAKAEVKGKPPTIMVELTSDGLKVALENWRHDAKVSLLAALDVTVQREIHKWRGAFLAKETKFNTPNLRQTDLNEGKAS